MFDSLYNFVSKSVAGVFSSCFRSSFHESSDSSSDYNSEDEKPKGVITKRPTKKLDIGNTSKELSLRDLWLYIDDEKKDAVSVPNKSPEISERCKQKKETVYLNIGKVPTDVPKKFTDFNLSDTNGYISLKVLRQEEDSHVINEFVVPVKQFRKRFRIMKNIMRSTANEYNEVFFSAKACIILIRFLFFNDDFYINNLDAAIETLVLAVRIGVKYLKEECIRVMSDEGRHLFQTKNVWRKNLKNIFYQHDIGQTKCFIGYSQLLYGSDIYFPFDPIQLTLNEAFEKDIINTATFESVKGCYLIIGVELCFNIEKENCNFPLNIIYKVSGDHILLENEIQTYLKPVIRLHFMHEFMIASSTSFSKLNEQKIEIYIIVQDLKPRLCFSSLDPQYVQKTYNGEFNVSLSSSRKSDSNASLFYLKKLYIHNINQPLPPLKHPSESLIINIACLKPSGRSLEIFTDGSKIETVYGERTGCAFAVFLYNTKIYSSSERLSNESSLYRAELWAILNAIQWAKECFPNVATHIFSDSLSSLQSIKNPASKDYVVNLIQESYTMNITFSWVKAHIGILGNEEADRLAKQGCLKAKVDIEDIPTKQYAKAKFNAQAMKDWQDYWDN